MKKTKQLKVVHEEAIWTEEGVRRINELYDFIFNQVHEKLDVELKDNQVIARNGDIIDL